MSTKRNITYKCPFCNGRFNRSDLSIHIGDEHEDLLPQGYSPLRYTFNFVNKKPIEYSGCCTECKGPTVWVEEKARYNRQCDNPKCKESFIKNFENNMIRTKGVARITSTAVGQELMLSRRKISGEYKFKNGIKKTYTGSYELKALKFMDEIMHIDPNDILCPGPVLEYEYNGKIHMYITDFYYQPYNLIIEVKDGGNRPNGRTMLEYRQKQIAKEKFIIKETNFNYLRLTDNDLSQLLSVFADLKMQLVENTGERVIHINENSDVLLENIIFNNKDIYKNFDKFESGESNILLITGLSGSGKSTIAKELAKKYNAKHFELDCLDFYLEGYLSLDKIKSEEPALYDFIKYKKLDPIKADSYIEGIKIYEDYLKFIVDWCKSRKNKFIIEGLQIYEVFNICDPQEFITSYPLIIKGTSGLNSSIRGAKRNMKYDPTSSFKREFKDLFKWAIQDNKELNRFKKSIKESMCALTSGYLPGMKDTGSVYIINYSKNNVFSNEKEYGYCVSGDPKFTTIFGRDKEGKFNKSPDNFLENAKYDVYLTNISTKEFSNKVLPYIGQFVEEGFIYESLFGKKMYTYDQIKSESNAYKVIDYNKGMQIFENIVESYVKGEIKDGSYIIESDFSLMSLDYSNNDKSCVSYISLIDDSYKVESVDFPEFKVICKKEDLDDCKKILEGLSIGGNFYEF